MMINTSVIPLRNFELAIDMIRARHKPIFTRQELIDTHSEVKRKPAWGLKNVRSSPPFISKNRMTHNSSKRRNEYDLSGFKLSVDALDAIRAEVAAGNKNNAHYLTRSSIKAWLPELIETSQAEKDESDELPWVYRSKTCWRSHLRSGTAPAKSITAGSRLRLTGPPATQRTGSWGRLERNSSLNLSDVI